MQTGAKKKIRELQMKKPLALSRLIKCYVCNQHFQSQSLFEVHLKHHQNKLNRKNTDEIQRKTQESFYKKKQHGLLSRTQTFQQPGGLKKEIESTKESIDCREEKLQEDQEEQEIGEALKESMILLEKIEFMTQVSPAESTSQPPQQPEEQPEYLERNIEGERKLHQLIRRSASNTNIEKLILQTNFEAKYYENYQDQLTHLRILASAAVSSESIAKIMDIRRKIARDICNQLKEHFQVQQVSEKPRPKTTIHAEITQNTGQVRFCADCYSQIGGMDDLYEILCGHCYHPECWSGQCCS